MIEMLFVVAVLAAGVAFQLLRGNARLPQMMNGNHAIRLGAIVVGILIGVGGLGWLFSRDIITTPFLAAGLLGLGIGSIFLSAQLPAAAQTTGRSMATLGGVLALMVFIFGETILEDWRQEARRVAAVGDKGDKPLTDAELKEKKEKLRQEGELAAAQAAADAKARAAAEAVRRSTAQVVSSFPTHVVVPHCDDGWSEALVMVSGWDVAWRWPGRVFGGAQFQKDGRWETITAAFTPDADAFRFCGKSRNHLKTTGGRMPVAFTPK